MRDDLPKPVPCWIVWQRADDGGRPYLVSIDTSEELAQLHVRAVMEEARAQNRVMVCHVEQSWLNHKYGESMGQGFDALKKMMLELKAKL